ncbi:MAG: metal ABC transporter substrate-binding protein, partial [Elusimicrobiota bacterium]|nr:metal ABC transporter substrate-binding protein [Elusimicrobiota bacterium]
KNAKIIVAYLAKLLMEKDPKNADFYKQNADNYIKQLDEVDAEFRQIVNTGKRKVIVFGDRFPLRYFADYYGLQYYAAFPGCSTETEASAATIKFLIDKVRADRIPVVFYIEFSNQRIAKAIAESTKAKTLLFQSAHNVTKAELTAGITYVELMRQNAKNLREALN